MNLILFEPWEVQGEEARLAAEDVRALHLREVLRAEAGKRVRVGVVDGAKGEAEVVEAGTGGVRLRCHWEAVPERPRLDVMLAMPRPKALKRLWSVMAMLGAGKIWICSSRTTERAYAGSHVLEEGVVREELKRGLCQARDTRLPEVRTGRSLQEAVEEAADEAYAARLLAHPGGKASDWEEAAASGGRVLLAVGPERGWTMAELAFLEGHRFQRISLGERALRSDVAVVALMAVLGRVMQNGQG